MSENRTDPGGTVYTVPGPATQAPAPSGMPITVFTPQGPVPGHLVGSEAVPDRQS